MPAAGGAEEGGERSRGRGKVDARQRLDLSVLQAEPLGDAGGEKAANVRPREARSLQFPGLDRFKKPLPIGRVPARTLIFDTSAPSFRKCSMPRPISCPRFVCMS